MTETLGWVLRYYYVLEQNHWTGGSIQLRHFARDLAVALINVPVDKLSMQVRKTTS